MYRYEVGQVVQEFIGIGDCVTIAFDGSGILVCQLMDKPTEAEIRDARSGRAEFRMVEINGLIEIAFKLGSQPWNDASYSPLIGNPPEIGEIPDNLGIALLFVLADTRTGKVCVTRLFGLSNKFSKEFVKTCEGIRQTQKNFGMQEYTLRTMQIQERYTSKQLAELARCYCKFS